MSDLGDLFARLHAEADRVQPAHRALASRLDGLTLRPPTDLRRVGAERAWRAFADLRALCEEETIPPGAPALVEELVPLLWPPLDDDGEPVVPRERRQRRTRVLADRLTAAIRRHRFGDAPDEWIEEWA
ncbi:hypothetical protein [Kineococcus terrestris]|uniref:hypothetical protein n=1 Tax=Kineococcus terrestris TaxID=2044856 RepID=UPI0034DB5E03